MTLTKTIIAGAAVLAGLAASGGARADVVVSRGHLPGNADKVLYTNCTGSAHGASALQGCLNSARSTLIDLTTTGDLAIGEGDQVERARNGSFNDLAVSFADGSGFDYLRFQLVGPGARGNGGTVTFTASLAGKPAVSQTFAINGQGENFFTVRTTDGDAMTSFRLVSDTGLRNINQIHLNPAAPIPEPGEWAMMLAGLGVVGWMAKRQRAREARA